MRLAAVISIAVAAFVTARPLTVESVAAGVSLDRTLNLPDQVLRTDDRHDRERPRHRRPHQHSEEELDNIQIEFNDEETSWTHVHHHVEMEDDDEPRESSNRGPSFHRPEPTDNVVDENKVEHPRQRPQRISGNDSDDDFQRSHVAGEDHSQGRHHRGAPTLAGLVSMLLGLEDSSTHSHHGCHHPSYERPSHNATSADLETDVAGAELDADSPPPPQGDRSQLEPLSHPSFTFDLLFALSLCFKLAVVGSVAVVAARKLKQVVRARRESRGGAVKYEEVLTGDDKSPSAYEALGEVLVVPARA